MNTELCKHADYHYNINFQLKLKSSKVYTKNSSEGTNCEVKLPILQYGRRDKLLRNQVVPSKLKCIVSLLFVHRLK